MIFAVLSFLGVVAAHQSVFNANIRDLRAQSATDVPTPDRAYFGFSVSGVVVHFRSKLRVYYDSSVYDASTLKISASSGSENADKWIECNGAAINLDYAEVEKCPDAKSDFGVYEYKLRATLKLRDSEATKTIEEVLTVILRPRSPWPLENVRGVWPPTAPNAVANLFEDYQTFGGTSSPYWHQGLDIRSTLDPRSNNKVAGPCRTPVDGKVIKIVQYGGGSLYWSLMVLDNLGFVWQFHHLDPSTYAVKVGDVIKAGTILGKVVYWPVAQNGHLYHHVHMNVVRPNPAWGDMNVPRNVPNPYIDGWIYFNPYDMLDHGSYQNQILPYSDGIVYFLKHGTNDAFAATSGLEVPIVSGVVDIVINFAAEFNKSNDVPGYPYVLGVKKLAWEVEPVSAIQLPRDLVKDSLEHTGSQTIPDRVLIDMDRMGPDWKPCAPKYTVSCSNGYLLAIHRKQFSYKGKRYQSIFNYDYRKVYYSVTNSGPLGYPVSEKSELSGWNTLEKLPSGALRFPSGLYNFTITAENEFQQTASVTVTMRVEN